MKIFGTAALLVMASASLTFVGVTLFVWVSVTRGAPIPWFNGDSGMILLEALLVTSAMFFAISARQLWALRRELALAQGTRQKKTLR